MGAELLQQGARQGDALALAAGESDALVADKGIVALGQPTHERVRLGGPCRRFDVGERRPRASVGDVVTHCPVQ